MFWVVGVFIAKLADLTYRYCLRQALALPPRGGTRNDRLYVKNVSQRLDVEWNARDIHPWDLDDRDEVTNVKFLQQFLADTDAAIERIFRALPHIDQIEITVTDPASDRVIASGTVDRGVLSNPETSESVRMRLIARGIRCDLNDAYFAHLQTTDSSTR